MASASTVRPSTQNEVARAGGTIVVKEQGTGSRSIRERANFDLGV